MSTPRASCAAPSSPCPGRRGCAVTSSSPAEPYPPVPAGSPVPAASPVPAGPPGSPILVAVIGSARLEPPDPRCALAERIGALIAARGWTLVTGGYGGLMAVTSQAAAQAGGTVIGLPMRGWDAVTPNRWNHELRWSDSYPERLAHLLAADAVVVLDGGIGTLSEAATVWAALQTEPDAADLVFLGVGWGSVLQALSAHLVIDDRDLAHVTLCTDPEDAVAHIASFPSRHRPPARPQG